MSMTNEKKTSERAQSNGKGTDQSVSFYCAAPRAKLVELAGDFNGWHPLTMRQSVDGWWRIQVPLRPGHHQYRFLVDGMPMLDPHATGVGRDQMNQRVSLVAVS